VVISSDRSRNGLMHDPRPRIAMVVCLAALALGCGDDPRERVSNIYELKMDPTPANVEAIRGYLDDEDLQVRVTAMYQLVELGVPDAQRLALESLDDPEGFVRMMAAQQLRSFSDPEVARRLAERVIEDEDSRVRRVAAESVAEVGGDVAIEVLGRCLTDPIAEVRKMCVEGLARLDPAVGVETLVRLLSEDPEWEVRVQAARALGLSGDRSAMAALEAATEDVHEYVRGAAAHALDRLRSAPVAPEPATEQPLTPS